MSRSQSPRLVDMLEFDSDDDFYDRVFDAYKKLYADCDDKTLILCRFNDNYEMYWTEGSPGAETVKPAVELLGLKGVEDPDNNHTQSWFKASRTDKLTKLAEAGFTVKIADWVDGRLQVV
jgi:hypothetical protein